MRTPLPVLALLVALLPACASEGGGTGLPPDRPRSSGWGGVVMEEPPPPEPMKGALSIATPSVKAPPQKEFSAEERAFFDRSWALFRKQDREWPVAMDEWRGRGPEAEGLLAENLYLAMVASRAAGAIHLLEECRKELVLMGPAAVPVLVGGLATRAIRTSDGQEIRVGQEVLHDAAEALSLLGPPAVPGLLDIARGGEKSQVREAVGALGNIGDPRAEELLLRLAESGDWDVRASAVLALRKFHGDRVRHRLVASLLDEESLVVERSAEALVTGRRTDALPGVVEVLERAVAGSRTASTRAAVWVLSRLTGQKLGTDVPAWRRWIRENP